MRPTPNELEDARAEARAVAQRLRLSFAAQKGLAGNQLGVGIGSSIDYQDHRPFLPGDDPRYLDWKAYARTGQFTMKVYRAEVTPQVDLLLDASASMFADPDKRRRTLELVYFVAESTLFVRASLACWSVGRERVQRIDSDTLLAGALELEPERSEPALVDLSRAPLRSRSLRIFVTDLLFPGEARHLVSQLSVKKGQALLFAPFTRTEAEPTFEGNRELVDVESGASRVQRLSSTHLERYRRAYQRHFSVWREECRRQDVLLSRVAAEPSLEDALVESLRQGAVVPWH